MNLLVLTAPSGAGKTTIARRLMAEVPGLRFSVSATTRAPRVGERDGVDYHYLTVDEFEAAVERGEFLEHEEVYPGRYYGTLRPALDALAAEPGTAAVVLDVDVKGALNVKRLYGDAALTLFIAPPSLEVLAERLRARGTDSADAIVTRLARAEMELSHAPEFDHVIVNDDLERAVAVALELVRGFLSLRAAPADDGPRTMDDG